MVSATVTVCVAEALLPAASVALQVTTVAPSGNCAGASLVAATAPSTRSSAVAAPIDTGVSVPIASAVTSAGGVTAGGVVSVSVTVKVTWLELLLASVAVTVTIVAPSAKVDPEAGTATTVGAGSARSFAAGSAKPTTAPLAPVASTVMFAGGVTTGAVVSVTVTVCVAVPVLPAPSVALQVTVVAPTANGPVISGVGVNDPSTSSLALAEPSDTGVVGPLASTVTSAGGVTTGGVVSTTVIGATETLLVSSLSATTAPASPSTRMYHEPSAVPGGIETSSVEKPIVPGLNGPALLEVIPDPICVSEASSVVLADKKTFSL